jgi:hypothetical protein
MEPAFVAIPCKLWEDNPDHNPKLPPGDTPSPRRRSETVTVIALCSACFGFGARSYLSRMRDQMMVASVIAEAIGESVDIVGPMEYGVPS